MTASRLSSRAITQRVVNSDVAPTPWTRPSDWTAIPSITASDEKFYGLHAVYPEGSYLALIAAGAYTVDWGDGSATENIASGSTASHLYDYTTYDVGNTTLCSRGYKQVIVTVTPQGGQQLTALNLHVKHNATGLGTYVSGFLDIAVAGQYLYDLRIGVATPAVSTQNITFHDLERARILSSRIRQCSYLFSGCQSLQDVSLSLSPATPTAFAVTFTDSGDVVNATAHGLSNGDMLILRSKVSTTGITVGNTYYVINAATDTFQISTTLGGSAAALTTNGSGTFAATGNTSSMFQNCYALQTVPAFNVAWTSTAASMFSSCVSLIESPSFDTAVANTHASMFFNCTSLRDAPYLDTQASVSFNSMFNTCSALRSVPLYKSSLVTNFASMFQACYALQNLPLFDTSAATTMANMLTDCRSLTTIPKLVTSSCTNFGSMFYNCFSLETIPLIDTSLATSFNSLFLSCCNLKSVPLLNSANVTDFSSAFYNCYSLTTVPQFNTAAGTNFSNMFGACNSLQSVPTFNTGAGTNFNGMFYLCAALQDVPTLNTANATNVGAMFDSCTSLKVIPALDFSKVTTVNTPTGSNKSLYSFLPTGLRITTTFTGSKLSEAAITTLLGNLGAGLSSPTLAISSNYGAVAPVSLSGTTTAGSTTVTMASTTGIATGMQVTGTGTPSTTGIAVTFTDAGDTVNLTSHGLSDGDEVAFSTITTTTGIVINTIYYVVGATSNTFQVAATAGGSALALTTDGSGTLKYKATVTAIDPNVSVTLSRPATSSGTNTLAFRTLKTNTALLKGWTVTG